MAMRKDFRVLRSQPSQCGQLLGYDEAHVMPQYYDVGIDGVTYQRLLG
jgi:hypothetical protein